MKLVTKLLLGSASTGYVLWLDGLWKLVPVATLLVLAVLYREPIGEILRAKAAILRSIATSLDRGEQAHIEMTGSRLNFDPVLRRSTGPSDERDESNSVPARPGKMRRRVQLAEHVPGVQSPDHVIGTDSQPPGAA